MKEAVSETISWSTYMNEKVLLLSMRDGNIKYREISELGVVPLLMNRKIMVH